MLNNSLNDAVRNYRIVAGWLLFSSEFHVHIRRLRIFKEMRDEITRREGKDCVMGQAKWRCVGLPLEYQRVPASERVRPSVIKHALLMMRLSLLHWWGKERDQRPANWSQFLHDWVCVCTCIYACVCVHLCMWASGCLSVCKRDRVSPFQPLRARNAWFHLILLHFKNTFSIRLQSVDLRGETDTKLTRWI